VKQVLVASASSVVRAGLEALIKASPALAFAGSAHGAAGADFARQVGEVRPDVVLVELDGRDDAEWSELLALAARPESPAVVALTDDAQGAWAAEALRAGVRAILTREAPAEEIEAAVEAAAAGLVVLRPATVESLLAHTAIIPRGGSGAEPEPLTPREVEVLAMIAEGLGNKTIAHRLGISEHTVKFHVSSIFAKLGAASRTEAVKIGIRRGLVML
jgi:two-component system, NarL family, response regulator YdfI